ncbi:MAG: D-alanyl-D-alanine carboxypeptidase family protein [Pseudomonadota bacterium]
MKQIRRMNFQITAVALLAILFLNPQAQALETTAREAYMIDYDTGTILLDKNGNESMPPASMSKIMTAFMVFEHIQDGRLSLDDLFPVSEKAWRKGGSRMFVEVGDEVRVEDLLRGVIIQSGNDACIVLAEGLAGTEEAFANAMTQRAAEIGMTGSTFANATGWPHPNHRMTAHDLAILARKIISDFPEFYHYYSETEFTWNDIRQGNRNPLLYRSVGADGLKTGHTSEAGYGLTASAEQNGRRLILVVNGLKSIKARADESARLLSWGFREFNNYALFKAGAEVELAPVWLGDKKTVPLVIEEDLTVTLRRAARQDLKVSVNYESPIPVPIQKGQQLATLMVSAPEFDTLEVPLYAGDDVGQLDPFGRIVASVKFLVFGGP